MSDAGKDFAEFGIDGAAFDTEGPLSDGMIHEGWSQSLADAVIELEAFETCDGEDEGVEFTIVEFAEAGFEIAPGFGEDEVRTGMKELGTASEAAGADSRSLGKFFPSEVGRG